MIELTLVRSLLEADSRKYTRPDPTLVSTSAQYGAIIGAPLNGKGRGV